MRSDPPWPRSPSDSAAKLCRMSHAWQSRIPFSLGIVDWSRRSSTGPGIVPIPAALGSHRRWRRWWSGSQARTAAGDMTASWVRWPIWAIRSRTKQWEISCAGTTSLTSTGAESHDDLAGVHQVAHGCARRGRLLYRGGADLARIGDVLRAVL